MIEILHPVRDRARIDDLSQQYELVDGWSSARDELMALESFEPGPYPADMDDPEHASRYIAYPWRHTLVRLPDAAIFHRLRTARNRYLITESEQKSWSSSTIAVAGLSVGASLLNAAVLTGARRLRIADPDTLGPTNLNRLAGSVCDLGLSKAVLAQRRILETDPYCRVETFPAGFTQDGAAAFFGGATTLKANVVLEEVDDLAMKVEIRKRAKALSIPVVMVTDDGDNVILDVERYDHDPGYPLFHGRAGEIEEMTAASLRDPAHRVRIAGAIVGTDIGARMQEALTEVGRTIPSWPQLGTAATLAGAVGAMTARKIVCGDPVPSGRWHVRIDEVF